MSLPSLLRIRIRPFALIALLLSLVAVGTILLPGFRQNPQELKAKADVLWQEGSYALAVEPYRQSLKADPKQADAAEMELRIAEGLYRSQQWDAAVTAIEAFVDHHKEKPIEARAQVIRGRLYFQLPHAGYRVGKKITRGGNVPKSEGKEAPVAVSLYAEDMRKTHDSFLRAKLLFERFRLSGRASVGLPEMRDEISLNFDLALLLRADNGWRRLDPKSVDWSIDLKQPFNPEWPAPKQILYLYEQIPYLTSTPFPMNTANEGEKGTPARKEPASIGHQGTGHNAVLAGFAKAAYILELRGSGYYYDSQPMPRGRGRGGFRPPRPIPIAIPYTQIDPIRLLQGLLDRYPDDADADRMAYTIALWTEQKGDVLAAIGLYNAFKMRYPKSRWLSDALNRLHTIFQPWLELSVPGVQRPGQRAVINLSTANIPQVRFTAYRVHLEEIYGKVEYRLPDDANIYSHSFDDFERYFIYPKTAPSFHREKVAEWTATTSDNGKHSRVNDAVTTPIDTNGAYLIEARAGEKNEFRNTTLVIVSDLALVQKIDKNSLRVYTADTATGKPISGVKLRIWRQTWQNAPNYQRVGEVSDAVTGEEGIYTRTLPPTADDQPENSVRRADVLAYAEGNRYAVTLASIRSREALQSGPLSRRAYPYTDRPLYRPNQTVNVRAILTEGIVGQYKPAAGAEVTMIVNGPKGELLKQPLKAGEFGTVNYSFTLPPKADLGDYTISIRSAPQDGADYGKAIFRVEEYKKPEFTVSVRPEKTQIRIGETVKAVIGAKFFFGAPVVGAKVKYQVFRSYFEKYPSFRPRRDWYGDAPPRNTTSEELAQYQQGNSIYRQGEMTTDAKGEVTLSFPTERWKPGKGQRPIPLAQQPDQSYIITATVTDDSRREVTGAGSIQASNTQFRVSLRTDKNFLLPGETLKIEVVTHDVSDSPLGAKGFVHIFRKIPAIPERRERDPKTGRDVIVQKFVPATEEFFEKLFLQTEEANNGEGTAFWHTEASGDYRLEYRATDAWGNAIVTEASARVYGSNYDSQSRPQETNIALIPEQNEVVPGDQMRLLMLTPKPESYILFTEVVASTIVRQRVIFVPGRSTIINAPITTTSIPSVQYTATLIRDGEAQEVTAQINVVPEAGVLSLTLTPEKATYKPGDRATFHLTAKDYRGRPVRGEFSLGLVDEALLAMQADSTPDIRRSFYGVGIETEIAGAISFNTSPGTHEDTPTEAGLETHALVFPEGMGWLTDLYGSNQPIPPYVTYRAQVTNGAFAPRMGGGGRDMMGMSSGGFGGQTDMLSLSDRAVPSRKSRRPADSPDTGGQLEKTMNSPNEIFAYDADNSIIVDSAVKRPLAEAKVRRQFSDTAFWTPAVVTDADGNATVTFDMPDNITNWKATVRGLTADVKVGEAQAVVVTKKNLMARLQSPRFFVERDQVVLSANIHNYLSTEKRVRVELVTDTGRLSVVPSPPTPLPDTPLRGRARGDRHPRVREPKSQRGQNGMHTLSEGLPSPLQGEGPGMRVEASASVQEITLKPDGEARIDWMMEVKTPGPTKIKVVAQTDEESDAAEMEFPVLVHGVEKFLTQSGVLRNGGTASLTLDLPEMRRKGASLLDVQMQPSLAAMMLDALPYLEEFPYGCVEQTTSRFVPTVLVAKSLRDAGIDLETLGKRAQALAEQRKAIPPQKQYENSGYTYPKGVPGVMDASALASRLNYHDRSHAPIFNSGLLQNMVTAGLQRLNEMQRQDGSWGWWSGSTNGDPYLTAYVVEYLTYAVQADIAVRNDVLEKGYQYLHAHLKDTEDLHLLAYYSYVVSLQGTIQKIERSAEEVTLAREFLYTRRERLNAYGQALLALALNNYGEKEKANVLLRNLVNTATIDRERGTAHWESSDTSYWRWYNDKQETTAVVLRALVAISPTSSLQGAGQTNALSPSPLQGEGRGEGRDPILALAPMTVRWLSDNRRGGFWTSTRQTANVIQALLAYAKAQKELVPDYTVTVDVDGKVQKSYHITRENALLFDNRFLVGDEILQSGANKLTITMQGTGTLYWNSYLNYFDMQEPIKGVSNAIGVERKYYKIVTTSKKDRQGQTVSTSERVPLPDGATLTSGDIIEVELFLKSDNDYEYLVFEDMKPAGCEAVETRSGVAYGDGLCSNFELRDEKVAFFIDRLPQGTRRLTYRLRAEIPGVFHALPTNAYAFYTPDIRALSDEWRVTIRDSK